MHQVVQKVGKRLNRGQIYVYYQLLEEVQRNKEERKRLFQNLAANDGLSFEGCTRMILF